MRLVALVALAAVVAPTVVGSPQFLQAHQAADGGFAETGSAKSTALTAWAALGLLASRADPGNALAFLQEHETDAMPPTTRALVALAEASLGDNRSAASLPTDVTQTNTVAWTILALRQAGRSVPRELVDLLVGRQAGSGGWGWAKKVAPDSNDTGAVVQALRATGVSGAPIRRALAFLARAQNDDGGFALLPGWPSEAQSTAWGTQAFLAAGRPVPKGAFAYLRKRRRPDGSYALSSKYATTPVWVTAQVLPAIQRKPFPLRG